MARNPEIEAILETWNQAERCPPTERTKAMGRLNDLLDVVVARSQGQFTRDQVLDFLWPQYREFCRARKQSAKVSIAREAMKK
jgi:hypothetical protein